MENWDSCNSSFRMSEAVEGKGVAYSLERHWGRDGAIYFAVRHGRQRLAQVVRQLEGLRLQAAQAVKRFGLALEKDEERQRFIAE
jgi:hypothetical protein